MVDISTAPSMALEAYSDKSYSALDEQQHNKDTTWGLRALIGYAGDTFGSRLVANIQTSSHDQKNTLLEPFNLEFLNTGELEKYQQSLFSLGWELDSTLGENWNYSMSVSYDSSKTPKAGGRAIQKRLFNWAGSAAVQWQVKPQLAISASLGRRTRFPTLRELYGVALNRFILNPELLPETAWLGNLDLRWFVDQAALELSVSPWVSVAKNTLSKKVIELEGVSGIQRINLDGVNGYGLDVSLYWHALDRLKIKFAASWQSLKVQEPEAGEVSEILQRPKFRADLMLDYALTESLSSHLFIQRTEKSRDQNFDGEILTLAASTRIDAKLFYKLNTHWTLYSVVKNLNNALTFPQLGLPETRLALWLLNGKSTGTNP